MNEEKIIAMLRAFGCCARREIMTPWHLSKTFNIQWVVAKRWHRILSALPYEPVPDPEYARISRQYYQIDKTRKGKDGKLIVPEIPLTDDLYGFPGITDEELVGYTWVRTKGTPVNFKEGKQNTKTKFMTKGDDDADSEY